MAHRTCAIEWCDKPAKSRGWCIVHYTRWYNNGDPLGLFIPPSPIERFWLNVEPSPTGCWTWTGCVNYEGYGRFGENRRNYSAHRWFYVHLNGTLAPGLDIDHLCHNADPDCRGGSTCLHRRCVNPFHLEAVTPTENKARGKGPPAINARKTHCPRGHAYDIIKPNGGRWCSVCTKDRRAASAKRRSERRAAAKAQKSEGGRMAP